MSHPPAALPGGTDEGTGVARGCSSASLAPVWQLNALFIETLLQSSHHPAWRGSSWDIALGPHLPGALATLRDELCRTPVSLVDIGLNDAGSGPLLSETHTPARAPPPFLARDRAIHLAHVTLTLAWTLSRSDMATTSIVFGVSRSHAKAIGALAFHSIPKISERLSSAVRPRWMNEPRIWQRLSSFSERSSALHLPPVCARTLQRQFADLLPATSATHLLQDSRR
jgi:hypothetical protein